MHVCSAVSVSPCVLLTGGHGSLFIVDCILPFLGFRD